MLSSVESVSSTMITLMKSTGNYVAARIQHKKYKEIYVKTLKECIESVESNMDDYEIFKADIDCLMDNFDLRYKATFFNNLKEERKYYNLACAHALDIIINLNARFNTGMFDSELRGFKDKEQILLFNEDIFN